MGVAEYKYELLKIAITISPQILTFAPANSGGFEDSDSPQNWGARGAITYLHSATPRDDYLTKARDFEEMGIPEYWIVDFLGLGGRRFIGNPKQPTFSVYQLVEGEYQVSQFRGDNRIESLMFPELNLTAQQVFSDGE